MILLPGIDRCTGISKVISSYLHNQVCMATCGQVGQLKLRYNVCSLHFLFLTSTSLSIVLSSAANVWGIKHQQNRIFFQLSLSSRKLQKNTQNLRPFCLQCANNHVQLVTTVDFLALLIFLTALDLTY